MNDRSTPPPQQAPEPQVDTQPAQSAQPEPARTEPAPNQPVDTLRDGNLRASIWQNEAEHGSFYATTFSRTYRDNEGQFRDAHSFVGADLLKVAELARQAYTHTHALRQEQSQANAADPQLDLEAERRAEFKRERENEADQSRAPDRER